MQSQDFLSCNGALAVIPGLLLLTEASDCTQAHKLINHSPYLIKGTLQTGVGVRWGGKKPHKKPML